MDTHNILALNVSGAKYMRSVPNTPNLACVCALKLTTITLFLGIWLDFTSSTEMRAKKYPVWFKITNKWAESVPEFLIEGCFLLLKTTFCSLNTNIQSFWRTCLWWSTFQHMPLTWWTSAVYMVSTCTSSALPFLQAVIWCLQVEQSLPKPSAPKPHIHLCSWYVCLINIYI